jgi:acetyl esterase/lipase
MRGASLSWSELERARGAVTSLVSLVGDGADLPTPSATFDVPGSTATLDLFEPAAGREELRTRRTAAVLVHGGGFVVGSPRMKPVRVVARELTRAGYAVLSVGYPLARGRVVVADQVRAVRSALEHGPVVLERAGIAAERTVAVGFSAGATLLLLAVDELETSRTTLTHDATELHLRGAPRHVVSVFGLYDFSALDGTLSGAVRRFVLGSNEQAAIDAASPLRRRGPSVPVTFLHGDRDTLVPIDQAHALVAHREQLGLGATLHVVAGAGHAFFNAPASRAARDGLAAIRATIDHVEGA